MYLNIEFANGSNPWLCYGNKEKIKREYKRWKRNWDLYIMKSDDSGIMAKAYEKVR